MIPGGALQRLAGGLCSRGMCERVIEAFFADFQREWLEAATFRHRAFVAVRGYASFWTVFAGCLVLDAKNDFEGFAKRVLNRVALPAMTLGVLALAFGGPSWVRTGRIDWTDAARGMWEMSSLIAALIVARYRSRNADARSFPAFSLALFVAAAVAIFSRVNQGHDSAYQWIFRALVNMAWPFLIRRQPDQSPT